MVIVPIGVFGVRIAATMTSRLSVDATKSACCPETLDYINALVLRWFGSNLVRGVVPALL